MTQPFAQILGMGSSGERTVRGWESGEHEPTLNYWNQIIKLEDVMNQTLKTLHLNKNLLKIVNLLS